jgi:hypothetical protein
MNVAWDAQLPTGPPPVAFIHVVSAAKANPLPGRTGRIRGLPKKRMRGLNDALPSKRCISLQAREWRLGGAHIRKTA